jgi:hypothetical protein
MATGWQPIQLVVGNAWGRSAPVAFPGDALYAVVDMDAGATLEIPPGFAERGIYLASGSLSLGGETLASGELGLLPDTATPLLLTAREPSRLALLAGPTPDAHRILDWNFVSTRLERIRQARDDWQQGAFRGPWRNRVHPAAHARLRRLLVRLVGRVGIHHPATLHLADHRHVQLQRLVVVAAEGLFVGGNHPAYRLMQVFQRPHNGNAIQRAGLADGLGHQLHAVIALCRRGR